MLVTSDLMTVSPFTVAPETTLREIVNMMNMEGCRHLPVVDGERLVGIVTDRDVRMVLNSPILEDNQLQNEASLDTVLAESIMTSDPITVTPNTPAYRAAEMLSIYKYGALPVVADKRDGHRTLVGIVTVTDFIEHFRKTQKTPTAV